MEDFKEIYLSDKDFWPDHLKCNHCNKRVERGIFTVSDHWLNCLDRKDGLIVIEDEQLRKVFNKLSFNVD